MGLFGLSAERQAHKMRLALFRSALHQEIGWFDAHTSGELINRLTEYVYVIYTLQFYCLCVPCGCK
jgi:ABC-type multidrug transport system fused ATPase/permease subunit